MNKPQKLAALMPLIRLAGEAAPELPPPQRADIFEGIAIITAGLHADIHINATLAAEAIRDAETHQLTFAALLRQSTHGKEAA
ncbi:MAG: hypothetical protein HS117_19370 [Verrucomicrobiaceae bacterium]|nr:hypothetical protein [Verrucomicrobiaceae bacterium]